VLLAHDHQTPDIQELADVVGDSLALAQVTFVLCVLLCTVLVALLLGVPLEAVFARSQG
jgi:hypothetical protein